MRHVFEHKAEARRRTIQARRDCEARFTWDVVTREFAELIEETHARTHAEKRTPTEHSRGTISWVLGVLDDEPVTPSLRRLRRKKAEAAQVLCLFTRYTRPKDVIRARKYGFIFYRWDGTIANCHVIARSVLGRGWIGLLYPGEEICGDERALQHFLAAQPESVTQVQVFARAGQQESRFFRLGLPYGQGQKIFFAGVSIEMP
jgi:hypothetical protein